MSVASISLKEKQRLEREALILQAAEEVLEEKGYYATSMDEIAARVGIAKGTIYGHFPGKEDLVVALLERNMRTFLQGTDAIIAQQTTSRARLEALLRYIMSGLLQKQIEVFASVTRSLDFACQNPEREARLHGLWKSLKDQIVALIEEGKASGEFKQALSTRAMLCAFFSLLDTRRFQKHLFTDVQGSQQLVDELIMIYFAGIASDQQS
jgi:TetR/AcrR family transcriptional regulator, fatty acid metabolism regulator protein